MKTNKTKKDNRWGEEKIKFMKILNKGRSGDLDAFGCAEYNPEEAEEAWQLILSTLQEYADERNKILAGELLKQQMSADLSRGDGAKNVELTSVEYQAIFARLPKALHKLNITYGLKGKK